MKHHIADKVSEYATIINNQMCDYPNKDLAGVGVTGQLLRTHEEICNKNNDYYTEQLLDTVAGGLISDMMNSKSIETRAIVNLGLSNIKNPFLRTMAKTNEYSIQKMNGINYYSIAFYCTPYLNAVIRTGTMAEKLQVFKAMCLKYAFEEVPNSKRGHKGEKIPLYEEAVTVAQRVKRLQTKLQNDAMAAIEKHIKDEHLLDNAILAVVCEPGEVEKGVVGLVANKLQAKYQRPSTVLIKTKMPEDNEIIYRGSLRNYSLCENQDFRQVCLDTNEVELASGHANAAGLGIKSSKFNNFIKKTNEFYKDIDLSANYWVDYIGNQNTIDSQKIFDIADLNIYGQEIPESLVVIENIPLSTDNVTLMSADKNPTIKIQCGTVALIKFKSSVEEYEEGTTQYDDGGPRNRSLTIIGKCNKNEGNGRVSPQILIEDFELQQKGVF